MNDDELGRLLGDAFDQQARTVVGDHATPPPPRFATGHGELHPTNSWRRRWWAPVVAAAAVVAAVGIGAELSGGGRQPVAGVAPSPTHSPLSAYQAPAGAAAVRTTVTLRPTSAVGVGLPVVVALSRPITDGRAWQAATRVTVDGRPLPAAWYFERTGPAAAMTAHLRPQSYWPAHASIRVEVAAAGLSAGRGLAFADDVQVAFRTAAARVAVVDGDTHRLTLAEDGRRIGIFPVSLGADRTPTTQGVKVVMAKADHVCLTGPNYHVCNVRYTQRLTAAGEYLVSSPWSVWAIGQMNISSGSTDLRPADAQQLYRLLAVGDVLDYRNCQGPMTTAGQGYGDWNVPWAAWRTGGLVPTS
ncbi:MAG TPA: L,D-transpeptidase [Jatrophihabitans sp.]|jgi:lipoprotein-anchoring transpeptidase ErfK/SrfK|uniref:L,D-transpeptidase n=1 Tax=Jatrophihabitans sp. TaxID=1932789 RepID=UPI002E0C7767|nr:L,D-transpeptidase [Jatrophihabitans sp.]